MAQKNTENITYVPGTTITKEIDIQAVVEAARSANVVIVCLGEQAYSERPGNITDLSLPEVQLCLAEAISQTGTPIVLILVEGRPRIINAIQEKVQAILMAYLPGMEGGRAIADIISGDVIPSGKLPFTYPRSPNDLTLYDHKYSENYGQYNSYNPQFPFGFGLSYTTFEYSDLQLSQDTLKVGDSLFIYVTVKNSGSLAGKEVVQLYLGDLYASITPSVKRLKRFKKIYLEAQETKRIDFKLYPKDFSFIGRDYNPVVEPGEFKISIGNLNRKFVLK